MTHVHYKFSSKLSYNTVVFDGPHITLNDLKRQIMGREKLRAADCDLQITNAQTKDGNKKKTFLKTMFGVIRTCFSSAAGWEIDSLDFRRMHVVQV